MKCGVGINDYWDLTIGEMKLIVETYSFQKKEQMKNELYISYQTSLLTALFVANSMNGKKNPTFYEIYKDLDEEAAIEAKRLKIKNGLLAFAANHNRKFKEA